MLSASAVSWGDFREKDIEHFVVVLAGVGGNDSVMKLPRFLLLTFSKRAALFFSRFTSSVFYKFEAVIY